MCQEETRKKGGLMLRAGWPAIHLKRKAGRLSHSLCISVPSSCAQSAGPVCRLSFCVLMMSTPENCSLILLFLTRPH